MSVLYSGGELTSFYFFGAVERSADFVAPARLSIGVSSGQWIETIPFQTTTADLWLHASAVHTAVTASKAFIEFKNSSGVVLVRMLGGGKIQYYNGGSYVDLGTITFGDAPAALTTIDLRVRGGTSGFVEAYIQGQFVARFSASMPSVTGIDRIRFSSTGAGMSSWSQVIVANEETIGWVLATQVPNAAGSYGTWSGNYSNINELILDDSGYISSLVEGQLETWKASAVDTSSTAPIKAVVLSARARRASTGPQNMNAVIRISGNDYTRAVGTLDLGFSPTQAIYETNPATSQEWTPTTINVAEFGVKSVI